MVHMKFTTLIAAGSVLATPVPSYATSKSLDNQAYGQEKMGFGDELKTYEDKQAYGQDKLGLGEVEMYGGDKQGNGEVDFFTPETDFFGDATVIEEEGDFIEGAWEKDSQAYGSGWRDMASDEHNAKWWKHMDGRHGPQEWNGMGCDSEGWSRMGNTKEWNMCRNGEGWTDMGRDNQGWNYMANGNQGWKQMDNGWEGMDQRQTMNYGKQY